MIDIFKSHFEQHKEVLLPGSLGHLNQATLISCSFTGVKKMLTSVQVLVSIQHSLEVKDSFVKKMQWFDKNKITLHYTILKN